MSQSHSQILHEATPVDGIRLLHKRYADGLRMGRHAHDEWRFCLVLSGSYTDSWRRGYRTRAPRDLSVHPAGEIHTSVFHSRATCFHVELTQAWRDRLLGDAGIAPAPTEFLNGRVPAIAAQLYQEFRQRDISSPLIVEGLTCELIGWASRESGGPGGWRGSRGLPRGWHDGEGAGDAAAPAWLIEARDLLHDRFRESLSLHDIASTLDVHPVHLARAFKRRFGTTIGAYVRQLRVDFVRGHLARDADAALADLAMEAGFADQSHLTRVFKQITGCTPTAYCLRAGTRRR